MKISVGTNPRDLAAFETINAGTLDNLKKIITSQNYSLGSFKDSTRKLDTFEGAEAIGLDFDDGMTLAEAKETFKDYTHIIATTRNHGLEKNGKVADRFRVILKLATPITDVKTFEATWFDLARKFPACDRACKDASRFFYPSKTIESYSTTGLKVEPVAPPQPVPRESSPDMQLPTWQKGKLAKTTQDFLSKGTIEHGRNNTVHKVARDFNQALYSEDEATEIIMDALNKHGILASDFPEREAEAAISSAFAKEPKHPPRVEPKAFSWRPIGQFMREAKKTAWLVDGLLTVGGVSIIVGDPKSGKSTLVRQMMKAVSRGETFLGRKCKTGPILHLALEEQEETLNDAYKKLGVNESDKIHLHVGSPHSVNFMDDLRADLKASCPALLIIDTLFLLAPVESTNDYSQVNAAMTPFRNLARETDTHILFVHHTRKGGNGGGQSIAGSQAIHGAVDCAMIVSLDGYKRRFESSLRGGKPFLRVPLEFDFKTETYSLGKGAEDPF